MPLSKTLAAISPLCPLLYSHSEVTLGPSEQLSGNPHYFHLHNTFCDKSHFCGGVGL